jgi:cyclohexa-1,5-dienecarbonyl-CoA hydratase
VRYEHLRLEYEADDRVATLTVDRPEVRNALDGDTIRELHAALAEVRERRSTVLILTGSGDRAFVSGADIRAIRKRRRDDALASINSRLFAAVEAHDAVTIAAINGVALGGGCELALACDFVLASDRARFGQPEINLGVFPPVAAWQLSRQTAPRKGLELLLTGDPVDAATAERLGLVNAVFPSASFQTDCNSWLARLFRQSSSTLRLTRRAFRLAQSEDFADRLAAVEKLYLDELMNTADAAEGLNAFLEKRPAAWKGR